MANSLHEFEEQLQQEALASTAEEVQLTADEYTIGGALVRKDPDGTVYEFDPEKHAWFPKVPFRFRMRFFTNTTFSVCVGYSYTVILVTIHSFLYLVFVV